jgi:hypothetical protein
MNVEEWRTIQIFLSNQGVHDVEANTEDSKMLRCNCPHFLRSGRCKHAKFVKDKMEASDGHYSIEMNENDAPPEDVVLEAIKDPKSFRELLVRYADIEVID